MKVNAVASLSCIDVKATNLVEYHFVSCENVTKRKIDMMKEEK